MSCQGAEFPGVGNKITSHTLPCSALFFLMGPEVTYEGNICYLSSFWTACFLFKKLCLSWLLFWCLIHNFFNSFFVLVNVPCTRKTQFLILCKLLCIVTRVRCDFLDVLSRLVQFWAVIEILIRLLKYNFGTNILYSVFPRSYDEVLKGNLRNYNKIL